MTPKGHHRTPQTQKMSFHSRSAGAEWELPGAPRGAPGCSQDRTLDAHGTPTVRTRTPQGCPMDPQGCPMDPQRTPKDAQGTPKGPPRTPSSHSKERKGSDAPEAKMTPK